MDWNLSDKSCHFSVLHLDRQGKAMTPEQKEKSYRGYLRAIDLPPDRREAFIVEYAPDDEAVQAKIRAALAASEMQSSGKSAIPHAVSTLLAQARHIGQYRVEKHIGGGGFGDVYLATDPFGAKVAIKALKSERDSEVYLETFKRERQIIADLDHTDIVRLIDGGSRDIGKFKLHYSVMEYIDGEPIDEYCNNRELSIAQRVKLFIRVCEVMRYVHRRFVAHSDLKPGNILVTEEEGITKRNRIHNLAQRFIRRITKSEKVTKESRVKLLDFGIATLFGPHPHLAPSSADPQAMTLEYASPEQAQGAKGGVASDIYSLGAVLYKILTGRPAHSFPPGSNVEEMKRIIREAPPSLPSVAATSISAEKIKKLRRRLRGDLDSIILKALDKDPQRRYGSSSGLEEDLRRYLKHLPVMASNQTFLYRTTKWIQRNKIALAVLAFPILLMIYRSIPFSIQYAAMYFAEPAARANCETAVSLGAFAASEVQDEIKKRFPDSQPARRKLAESLLSYLSVLEPKVEDNIWRQQAIGDAYYELGNKFRDVDSGDGQLALRCYQGALNVRNTIYWKATSNDEFRKELADAYHALSGLKQDLGDWKGAEEDRRNAVEIGKPASSQYRER